MGCRFQHVMAAMAHQAATDKDDIAYCVNAAQFTNRINQYHWILRTGSADFFQFGTETGLITKFAAQSFNLAHPAGLTGCNDQSCFGILLEQFGKGSKYISLFRGMG